MKRFIVLLSCGILTAVGFALAGGDSTAKKQFIQAVGEQQKVTDAGNIRLSVSSFGTIGSGFSGWPGVPSCEYPRGSGIENMFIGGLWAGGVKNGGKLAVSTAAVDISAVRNLAEGFEYTNMNETYLIQRSSLPTSLYYSPKSISHLDLIADFTDTNLFVPELNQKIPAHTTPLGLAVHFESYSWNFPYADYFVILSYSVKNVFDRPIDSVYFGLWTDLVVRNTKITRPSGSAFYAAGGNGILDSLNMMYEWDAAGDNGLADNYAAVRFLGSEPPADTTHFNTWGFRNTSGDTWEQSPADDDAKYKRLSTTYLNEVTLDYAKQQLAKPLNRSQLISFGPFSRLNPGDSVKFAFAVICAKKTGAQTADNDITRKTLYKDADWAQRAYNGTDANGNNRLDSNERDLHGDGSIVRYVLPAPPPAPRFRVETGRNEATLYWADNAENSTDIITNRKNFEGYRIYRSNAGDDTRGITELHLAASYDKPNNGLFFDNGFDEVRITNNAGNPQKHYFDGDTVGYSYRYHIPNLLDGWLYTIAITSFSEGNPDEELPSLETSTLETETKIITGSPAAAADTAAEIGIFPNPYYTSAAWDSRTNSERGRKVYFYNLPERARITVFSVSGDKIYSALHEAGKSHGADIEWFSQTNSTNAKFSSGIHAWDIISEGDQAVAHGLYIVQAEDLNTGKVKTGKMLILK